MMPMPRFNTMSTLLLCIRSLKIGKCCVIDCAYMLCHRYLGLDTSLPVIQANRWQANFSKARRASQSGTCEFKVLDMTREPIPQGYDLLFSHDHLEHLPMHAVLDVLEGFMHSNADVSPSSFPRCPQVCLCLDEHCFMP
jgi:hypothetical protein